jgi:hypothetical protein
MKLIEITNNEVGRIYKTNNKFIIIDESFRKREIYYYTFNYDSNGNSELLANHFILKESLKYCKLIGFINITHKIENNKLVEIERKEFEVDDIIKFKNDRIYVITKTHTCGNGFNNNKTFYTLFNGVESWESFDLTDEYFRENSIKIGIYGVTHKFVNDKLLIKE